MKASYCILVLLLIILCVLHYQRRKENRRVQFMEFIELDGL